MDKVTGQCPQTTTFLKRNGSRSGTERGPFRLPLGQTGSQWVGVTHTGFILTCFSTIYATYSCGWVSRILVLFSYIICSQAFMPHIMWVGITNIGFILIDTCIYNIHMFSTIYATHCAGGCHERIGFILLCSQSFMPMVVVFQLIQYSK